ncbi:MAG: hypothetical protein LBI27_06260, partial [Clostridiales bacterium]|nr:hypothetical protein [Clostridiales bacterium]
MELDMLLFIIASLVAIGALVYLLIMLKSADSRDRRLKSFFNLCLVVLWWTGLNLLTSVVGREYFVFIYSLKNIIVYVVPYFTCWFFLHLTHSKLVDSKVFKITMITVATFEVLLILTNPLHWLLYASYDGYPHFALGPFFYVHLAITTFVVVFSYLVVVIYVLRRRQPFLMFVGLCAILPFGLNIIYSFDMIDFLWDTTPLGYFAAVILFAYASYKSQMFHFRSETLSGMFNAVPYVIVTVNRQGYIVDANDSLAGVFAEFKPIFGKTTVCEYIEFLEGRTESSGPQNFYELVADMNTTVEISGELNISVGGEVKTFTASRFTIMKREKAMNYAIMLNDVTEYRRLTETQRDLEIQKQTAQAANDAKSQFLANMSHEIRTPMNAIIGMSDLLLSENLSESQHRYAEDIRKSSHSLLSIINDILDLSKIQSEKLTLLPVHYNVGKFLSNIDSMIHFLKRGKKFVYKAETHDLPECLYGDDVRLRQVVLNLLSNAVKFTEKGSVILNMRAEKDTLCIAVSDTGKGIPAEDVENIFYAFQQADAASNRFKQGTGLGLAITKALVELMGGTISVESEYGVGSVFRIILPLVVGDKDSISENDADESIIYAPDAKILVVDDTESNLIVICGLLQQCEIDADSAISGTAAIEMVSALRSRGVNYDLIFMD